VAEKTKHIDLIIGGHTHVKLSRPEVSKNKNGDLIPIFHSGSHGDYIGQIVLTKGKKLKLKSYKLHSTLDVERESQNISDEISRAQESLNNYFGEKWLNQKVTYAKRSLTQKRNDSTWLSKEIAYAFLSSGGGDLSVHIPAFGGAPLRKGDVRVRDLFDMYPRIFDFEEIKGWRLYEAQIKGYLLSTLFGSLVDSNEWGIEIAGLRVEKNYKGKPKYYIGGERLKLHKFYKVILPEGVVRGVKGISWIASFLFFNRTKIMDVTTWESLINHFYSFDEIPGELLFRPRPSTFMDQFSFTHGS
jgi:hypothetical protein